MTFKSLHTVFESSMNTSYNIIIAVLIKLLKPNAVVTIKKVKGCMSFSSAKINVVSYRVISGNYTTNLGAIAVEVFQNFDWYYNFLFCGLLVRVFQVKQKTKDNINKDDTMIIIALFFVKNNM